MPSAVLDANIVIGLSKGGVFELLQKIYEPIYIPTSVKDEVISQPEADQLSDALGAWITESTPDLESTQAFSSSLSGPDRDLLGLAAEKKSNNVLTSDERLHREATGHGMVCLRITDLIVVMKNTQIIDEAKPVLDRMRSEGYGIDDTLYEAALRACGEGN